MVNLEFLKFAIIFVSIAFVLTLAAYIISVSDFTSIEKGIKVMAFEGSKSTTSTSSEKIQNSLSQSSSSGSGSTSSSSETSETEEISQNTSTNNTNTNTSTTTSQTTNDGNDSTSSCLERYGLTENTIIFYYQNEPHSNAMLPLVEKLESEYAFYWTDDLWDYEFNACSGHSTGTIPAFVCAGTQAKVIGELSEAELRAFAESC